MLKLAGSLSLLEHVIIKSGIAKKIALLNDADLADHAASQEPPTKYARPLEIHAAGWASICTLKIFQIGEKSLT